MPFSQPLFKRAARFWLMPVFRGLSYLLMRLTFSGLENVPASGPYLIVANHLASVDPAIAVLFWPSPPEGLAASNMMEKVFPGSLMRLYGAIPVHRGEYDRTVLNSALNILHANRPLLIMPEGSRSQMPGMKLAKPGAAYLALKAQVPLVPVGIIGTERIPADWKQWRRPRVSMTIGKPFTLPALALENRAERHQHLEETTVLIMKKIAELLPEEYRGVYA